MFKISNEEFKRIFPYETVRSNQKEIIEKIIEAYSSGKKYVILSAPTGTGKSCIGYSVARFYGSSYILTSQKILQLQYNHDFDIPYVLGKSNYTCLRNNSVTCDMGMCGRNLSKMCTNQSQIICPYMVAKERCLNAKYSDLNYSYFLSLASIAGLPFRKELIICDEAHNLEQELIKIATVNLDKKIISKLKISEVDFPKIKSSNEIKINWLINSVYNVLRTQLLNEKGKLVKIEKLKNSREYKNIYNKVTLLEKLVSSIRLLKTLIEDYNEQVVITHTKEFIEFKLLYCKRLFKEYFNNFSDKFLFMSASILDYKSFAKDLGLNLSEVEFIECDSEFPVENRLIHYTPVGSMSFKCKDKTIPAMAEQIDKILTEYKDVKGIIHTTNYDIAEKLLEKLSFSKNSARFIMPRGITKQADLDRFYKSSKPFILISPSLKEGIDLKDDLSRLCIICKVPYGSLNDEWIKTRLNKDQQWYIVKACTDIVQMSGRSVRSKTDYATTYILDSDFEKLAQKSQNIFPKWWMDAVVIG